MLLLPPSHKLVQLGTKRGEVTSKGSRHMILWPSRRPNGGGSLFQRFEAYDPSALNGGGGDLMVVGHCFRLVRKDTGASARGTKNQSSSSSRKK